MNWKYSSQFYVGPKDQKVLAGLADYLDLTIDYGFFGWLVNLSLDLEKIEVMLAIGMGNCSCNSSYKVWFISSLKSKSQWLRCELQPELTSLKSCTVMTDRNLSRDDGCIQKGESKSSWRLFPIRTTMPVFIALYWCY